jgi:hypothetical protein
LTVKYPSSLKWSAAIICLGQLVKKELRCELTGGKFSHLQKKCDNSTQQNSNSAAAANLSYLVLIAKPYATTTTTTTTTISRPHILPPTTTKQNCT